MCTNFSLFPTHANNVYTISARTLDLALNLQTKVSTFPRGQSFPQVQSFKNLSLPDNSLKWQSKYGYVAMHTGWQHVPAAMGITEGMNEKGLSIGALWLPDSQYPVWTPEATQVIPNCYFPAWVLGNFESVQSLKPDLTSVTVINLADLVPKFITELTYESHGLRLPLHYVVSDSTGANLIIEFTQEQMQCYDSQNGVLTNAPLYPCQCDNLCNYVNLSLKNYPQKWWGQEVNGSGCLGMPGDFTPPSRFVRAWTLQQSIQNYTPTSTAEAVGLAARILQNLCVPMGAVVTADGLDNSQWGVVRDHQKQVYYFFTQFNNNLFSIDLRKIDFEKVSPSSLPMVQSDWVTDLTEDLLKA